MKQTVSQNTTNPCLLLNTRAYLCSLFRYSLCCIDRSLQEISLHLLLPVFMSELRDLPSLLTCLVEEREQWWTRLGCSSSSVLGSSSCSGWFLNRALAIETFFKTRPAHVTIQKWIKISSRGFRILLDGPKIDTPSSHLFSAGNSLHFWQYLKLRTCFLFWSHYFLMMNLC